jgi:WhiB family transcriptional regulator, redox-sensing transcriptional regulator
VSDKGTTTAHVPDWRHTAACLENDPELFFPTGDTTRPGPAFDQAKEAKAVCHRCPAMNACLDWALANGQDHGIWGGLTEDERRRLKNRERRRRAAGVTG